MSEEKWTPGPWHVDPKRKMRVANEKDETVCTTGTSDSLSHQWEGNAQLCSAAPAMYRGLEAVDEAFEKFWGDDEWPRKEIRAALKAARGERDGDAT